ncbi:MAG: hypothetical protein PHN31_01640 [Candidatus Gracilibacteria bacterium]|nr:hypothetical protein [Candidatus Gracilibacteria bacterium]
MKNKDLIRIHNAITGLSNIEGSKFAYAMIKNKKLIRNELENIEGSIFDTENYKEYNKLRIELCEKFCEKNQDGSCIFINDINGQQSYKIENKKEFEKEILELQEKFKEDIEHKTNQLVEYNKLLDEEINIELFMIKSDDLPNMLTVEQTESIFDLIKD